MTNKLHLSLVRILINGQAYLWAVCEEGARGSE